MRAVSLLLISTVAMVSAAQSKPGSIAPRDEEKLVAPEVAMSPVKGTQGYATDGTLHYISDTEMLSAYDAQWKQVWQTKNVFADMFPGEDTLNAQRKAAGLETLHKHVGDIDVYDGKIYAPVESYRSCEDNVMQHVAVFSAKDGSFLSSTDISPYKHEISSIAIVPSRGIMAITSFCEAWEIPQYDLKTMQPVAPLKLDKPILKMQGIAWSEQRKMFVVTSDSPQQQFGYVWGVSPEGHVSLLHIARAAGEMEGVDYSQGQIRFLLHHIWSLAPAIGSSAKPLPEDALLTIATTQELPARSFDALKKLSGDFSQHERFWHEDEDLALLPVPRDRVVFFGDSITDGWGRKPDTEFFPGKPYVNRGISGQTTAQMLLRFRQDVIDLHPAVVVLLAGTNDIAGNFGPSSIKMAADNIQSMAELARAHGIRFVICSVPPSSRFGWRPEVRPAESIRRMNAWLKDYAAKNNFVYVDYYTALANSEGGLDAKYAKDGVHPTPEAYAIMAPLAEKGIAEALKKRP